MAAIYNMIILQVPMLQWAIWLLKAIKILLTYEEMKVAVSLINCTRATIGTGTARRWWPRTKFDRSQLPMVLVSQVICSFEERKEDTGSAVLELASLLHYGLENERSNIKVSIALWKDVCWNTDFSGTWNMANDRKRGKASKVVHCVGAALVVSLGQQNFHPPHPRRQEDKKTTTKLLTCL